MKCFSTLLQRKVVVMLLAIVSWSSVYAATFTVTNLNDSGVGSLRAAITSANSAGAGPHTISFSVSGTITINSPLPAITNAGITIDGGGTIIVSAQGGNIVRDIFTLNTGANNTVLKGMTLQNTGTEAIQVNGALGGVTIENITIRHTVADWTNYGIYVAASTSNMTIKNVTITDGEDAFYGVYFASSVTGLTIDGLSISNGSGTTAIGVRIVGMATNVTVQNSTIDLNDPATTDDGNYGLYFNTTVNGLTIANTTIKDAEVYNLYIGGAASNVTIQNSNFTNLNGWTANHLVRFNSTVNTISVTGSTFNADLSATTNDGDVGLYFINNVQNATITGNTFREGDDSGLRFNGLNNDNITISNNIFDKNGYGADGQAGIRFYGLRNTSSDGGAILVSNNTFTNNNGSAIYLQPINTVSYVIPNFTISGNTITGTKTGFGAIRVNYVDKIVITNNSIYNNASQGIELANGSGANCGYEGANRPVLNTSTHVSGNTYQLNMTLPAICAGGCNIEVYATDPGLRGTGGQYLVATLTGVLNGTSTHIITSAVPPVAGQPYGVWTATLRLPGNNCGTSEFSNKLPIQPNGPACVNAGVKLWLRGEEIFVNTTEEPTADGQVISAWEDFSGGGGPNSTTIINDPRTKLAGINFNPVADMDGDVIRGHLANAVTWLNSNAFTTVAVFNPLSITASGDRFFAYFSNASGSAYTYNTNLAAIEWYRTGNNIQSYRGNTLLAPAYTTTYNVPAVFSSVTNATTHTGYYNGTNRGSGSYNKGNLRASQWFVGGDYNAGWTSGAEVDFAEVVSYNRELTAPELEKVQSYLALKYGLTLTHDYVASSGVTLWNIGTNAGYNNYITGLARDNCSVLHQKQSKSYDPNEVVTIGVGTELFTTNKDNDGNITNNISALMWGHNGGSSSYTVSFVSPYSDNRMARVWKVDKTNWADQTILIKLKNGNQNRQLIVSADPTFSSGVSYYPLSATGEVTLNSSVLTDGIYFTFANRVVGPACVTMGIQGWYRADDANATSSLWTDYSGYDRDAIQATAAGQPLKIDSVLNFNPGFDFDGSNDYLDIASNLSISGTNNFTVVGMGVRQGVGTTDAFLSQPLTTNGFIHYWSSANKHGIGSTNISAVPSTGTYATANVPYFVSTTRSGNTFSNYTNGTADGSGNAAYNFLSSNLRIGNRATSGDAAFNGYIGEVAVYNRALSSTELQQVHSYLALKYGITMNNGTQDYIASNGTTNIWDASDNTGYNKDIAGIGKDTCTGLYQKQSKSVNTGALVTLAVGGEIASSNATNTDTIPNDRSFLVWGDNGGTTTFGTTVSGANATLRMNRVWKVDKTNWSDRNVFLKFGGSALNTYLLVSTSPTFATIDQELELDATGGVGLPSNLLPDGAYFTFAKEIVGPACVNNGVVNWLRADSGPNDPTHGSTVATWEDYSGNGNDATVHSSDPSYETNTKINFHPLVYYDGNDGHNLPNSVSGNYSIFTISKMEGPQDGRVFESQIGNALMGYHGGTEDDLHLEAWLNNSAKAATTDVNMYSLQRSSSGAYEFRGEGNIIKSAASGSANSTWRLNIGGTAFYNEPSRVYVAEVAMYNQDLSSTQVQLIESYLALKYGLTLNNGATDYLASDTTNMWDASDNTGYGNDIAGIGRDDCTGLHQRQSQSVNSDNIITMAMGTAIATDNASNTNDIGNDRSFLVWSNNNGTTTFNTAIPKTGINTTNRMARIWKVDKTNWADDVITICASQGGERYLLIDTNSAGFDNDANTSEYQFNLTTGCITLNSSALPDGAYFTLGTKITGPACVNTGIKLWLRSDYGLKITGTDVTAWADYSGNNANSTAVGGTLTYSSNNVNFYPSFNVTPSSNDFMRGVSLGLANDNSTARFLVLSPTTAVNGGDMYGLVGNFNSGYEYYTTNGGQIQTGNAGISPTGISSFLNQAMIVNTNTGAGSGTTYRNGKAGTPQSNGTIDNLNGAWWLGNENVNGDAMGMDVVEVIQYDRTLSTTELQLINSYLALKFGITLDQTTPINYIASDSSVYWNATTNAAYKFNIAGIGKDTCTELHQRQSKSVNTGEFLAIGLGDSVNVSNALNPNAVTNDRSFFVWGHNNLGTYYSTTLTAIGTTSTARMARVWKVDKTNWADQDITLCFTGYDDDDYLLISNNDATFGTINFEAQLGTNGCVTVPSSNIPDGAYFTLGRNLMGPACVNGGIRTWQRADDGASTITNWFDFSNNENTATQAVAADQATALTGDEATAINFNPGFLFETSADFFDYNNNLGLTGTSNNTVVWVANSIANTAATQAVLSHSTTGTNLFLAYHVAATNNPSVAVGGGGSTCAPASPGGVPYNTALIGTYNRTSASSATMYTNGGFANTGTCNSNFVSSNMRIGARSSAGYNPFNGNISEVIVYNRSLSTTELQKVHSYLALKYGITLDQTTPTDYLASDSTRMWDASDNTGYGFDIAGLGRDSCTALNQKQSKSVNSDNIITVALGDAVDSTNAANDGTMTDRSFLTWSNNNATVTFDSTIAKTGINATVRMKRTWKVDKTTNWNDQDITICVSQGGERYLLVDTDGGSPLFGNDANTKEYAFNFTSGCITINSADLPDGAIFSLGTKISGPACVDTGIKLWLRADYGVSQSGSSATAWSDFSGNTNNVTQATAGQQPTPIASSINYNPTLDFDGSNDVMIDANGILGGATYAHVNAFVVSIQDAQQASSIFQEGNAGATNYLNTHINWSDGNLYWDAGNSAANNRLFFANTITNGLPYLYALTARTGTGQKIFRDGRQMATDATMVSFTGNNRPLYIGQAALSGAFHFNGKIAEIAIYTDSISATGRQRIESYLALKYGLTMTKDNDGDNTNFEVANAEGLSEGDYLASDGTVYWDASSNSNYHNNVAGIGKDTCSDLYQRQSKSVNTGAFLTVALGDAVQATNAANTNNPANDRSFLVWGHNNLGTDFSTSVNSTTATARMARVWKVDKTNWVDQNITLCFSGYTDEHYLLIQHTDSTFATATEEKQLDANGCVTFDSGDLPDASFFTIGKNLIGPACVNGGIKLWLRADDGSVTDSLWADYSGNGVNAMQSIIANRPPVVNSAFNFNPALDFNGTTHSLLVNSATFPTGTASRTAFVISSTDQTSLRGNFSYGGATATSNVTFSLMQTGGNAYTAAHNGLANDAGPVAGYIINGPPVIQRGGYNGTQLDAQLNGGTIATRTIAINTGNTQGYIGTTRAFPGAEIWDGEIAEVILYNKVLSAAEVQRVQSYLALKYGITLDQTTPADYLASDGSIYWNDTDNTGYGNDIAGLGKDVCTNLHQKQSKSVNSDALITMAVGTSVATTNEGNPNSVTNDKSFLVWSNNNLATTFTTNFTKTGFLNVNKRTPRIWKVDKTNWADQDITICVSQVGERYLLIDNGGDADFADDSESSVHALSFSTGCVTINSSLLPDGAHFSLGTEISGPACVNTGIRGWYRADYGATAAQWTDYSGNSLDVMASGVGNDPGATETINFNPGFDFDGNDVFTANISSGFSGNQSYTIFSIFNPSNGDQQNLYAIGAPTTLQNTAYIPNRIANGGRILYHFGAGNDIILAGTRAGWQLGGFKYDSSIGNATDQFLYSNGAVVGSNNSGNLAIPTNPLMSIGGYSNRTGVDGNELVGDIAEFVVYNGALSDIDRNKVESYLSLKYGLTLDQTINTDYVASNWNGTTGTKMWTNDNDNFEFDIAGIGRDECTNLHQKQSASVNTGNILTVALGSTVQTTNLLNTNSVTNDFSFFTWAHDNGALDFSVTATGTNATARLARVWKVDKTNWADQDITICFGNTYANNYLIVNNTDGTFPTVGLEYQLDASGCYTLNSSDLPHGSFFTVGKNLEGPACVNGGIRVWLDANDGLTAITNGFQWNDKSNNNLHVAQTVDTREADLGVANAAHNFNAFIDFDGGDVFETDEDVLLSANSSGSVFFVSQYRDLVGWDSPVDFDTDDPHLGRNGSSVAVWMNGSIPNPFIPGSLTLTTTRTHLSGFLWNGGTNGGIELRRDALAATEPNMDFNNIGYTSDFSVGANIAAAEGIDGTMSEVIVYNRKLSATETQKVESYLALKYGITLDMSVTNQDYIASDGTNMWDWSDNVGYRNDVAGIGRDECTGLHQKQSTSINSDDVVTFALGSAVAASNAANTNIITNDRSFFTWANDNGNTNVFSTSISGATNAELRMARIWKVDKTNWADQNITICFDGQIGERYLLIEYTDATMSSTIDGEIALNPLTGCVTVHSSVFPDGAYFSIGTKILGPGCADNNNILTWLRGDYGLTVNQWNDFSGRTTHATQSTPANQPALATTGQYLNFNPALDFGGSAVMNLDNLNINSSLLGRDSITALIVYNADAASRPLWGNDNNSGEDRYLEMHQVANGSSASTFTGANVTAQAKLVTTIMDDGTSNGSSIYVDGASALTFTQSGSDGGFSYTMLGRRHSGQASGAMFDGRIAEFAVYRGALSATERRKAESYLAIKYGITLSGNYLATDGTTVVWEATANTGYNNDIAGIGRDTCTALEQKQSRSANSDYVVTIALGDTVATTNTSNGGSFPNDRSFLLWGSNNGTLSFDASASGTNATARLGRIWKVDKTNWSDQNVTLCFNGYDEDNYLLISDLSDFSVLDVEVPLDANGCVTISSDQLEDADFFTLGASLRGPACVNGSIKLWLRADQGTSSSNDNDVLASWLDISNNDVAVSAVIGDPNYESDAANLVNFNPAISFDGNDGFTFDSDAGLSGTNNFKVFAVSGGVGEVRYPVVNPADGGVGLWLNPTANTRPETYRSNSGADVTILATGPTVLNTDPHIFEWERSSNNFSNDTDGAAIGSATNSTSFATGNTLRVGGPSIDNFYLTGNLTEVIVYSRVLSATEEQQVRSYLALKYGITLDQTTAQDYLSSDGTTTMWDASDNGAYNNHIAGIGRDDCTNLYQKQSKSVNAQGRVTMGLGTIAASNVANTGTFDTDKQFMTWASNIAGAPVEQTLAVSATDLPTNLQNNTKRLDAEWKVDETGAIGAVQVTIDLTGLTISGTTATDLKLLIDRDGNGNFTDGTIDIVDAASFSSNVATFDNVNFQDGDVFALASQLPEIQLSGKVFLQGPYDAGSHEMSTGLNAANVLPLTDPYGLGITATTDPNTIADIVDWVKVELRDAITPTIVLKSVAAFVKKDGTLVDIDGSSTTINLHYVPGNYHIAIRHRNHLGVRTNAALNFTNVAATASVDFTVVSPLHGVYVGSATPRIQVEPGVWAMWTGDANTDTAVDATDFFLVDTDAILGLFDQYLKTDLNLDGAVDAVDFFFVDTNSQIGVFSGID